MKSKINNCRIVLNDNANSENQSLKLMIQIKKEKESPDYHQASEIPAE
jgi:hypothetical protein